MSETRSYPRHVRTDGGEIEFRMMSRSDEAAVLAFAQKLPTHDLLFLPRNISQPKVLSAWVNEIERGAITSLLAVKAGAVVVADNVIQSERQKRCCGTMSGMSMAGPTTSWCSGTTWRRCGPRWKPTGCRGRSSTDRCPDQKSQNNPMHSSRGRSRR